MMPNAISDSRPQPDRLDSWKEIAAYLRRGARTVQRWEREEGLPVRRLQHEKLGSVYAFPHEIDDWVARRDCSCKAIGVRAHAIAVLPFADLTGEGDQACFCDGVAAEIAHALARLDGLRTASTGSSFRYRTHQGDCRHVGRRLGVKSLVQGSVRKWGDRVRVVVELVDAESGFQQWSEHYDRTLGDVFRIQEEIAAAVTEALEERLTARKHAAGDLGAHECHARGHNRFCE